MNSKPDSISSHISAGLILQGVYGFVLVGTLYAGGLWRWADVNGKYFCNLKAGKAFGDVRCNMDIGIRW